MVETDVSGSHPNFNESTLLPGSENSIWRQNDGSLENHNPPPVQNDEVPSEDEEPLNRSHMKLNRSIKSMDSKSSFLPDRSGDRLQSLRSIPSRASFILDTISEQAIEDTEEEDAEILKEIMRSGAPVPPDGGYGWVIVFVSFMCNLILDGITCTFGVFLPQMAVSFQAGKGDVAWAGSLLNGVSLCIGPIVGALTNKYGCRIVCMVGSAIGCTAFLISSFADSLTLMLISYGLLGGIGFGLIYLPNIVSVGYYFEKRRALATGIAVCGSGFGATTFAPMASWLTGQTTWRSVNRVFAALLFICGCCGALIRPLEITREAIDDIEDERVIDPDPKRRPLLYRMAEERKRHFEGNSMTGSEYFMVQLPDGTMERRHKIPPNVDPGVHSTFHLDQFQFPGSPLPPMTPNHATNPLSTITESEQKQSSGSEGSLPVTGSGDLLHNELLRKTPAENNVIIESDARGIDIPISRRSSCHPDIATHSLPVQSTFKKAYESHRGAEFLVKGSSDTVDPESEHGVPFRSNEGLPNSLEQRRFSIKAVPVSSIVTRPVHIFARRDSMSSPPRSRLGSFTESVDDGPQMHMSLSKGEFPAIHHSLNWPLGSSVASTPSIHRIIRPMSRKDVFYSGSITKLPEYAQNEINYRQSILNLDTFAGEAHRLRDYGSKQRSKPIICPCPCLRVRAAALLISLQTFMDFSLLKNPVFLCIAISGVVGMLGFYVPFVYIIDFCVEKNISRDDGALLLSIIGVMNTVGRVGFGMLSDLPQVNSLYLNNFCILAMGVSVMVIPWCMTFAGLIVVYVSFGLFLSGFIALTSITLVDLLGLDNLTNSFGLLILFRGSACIIGSPFAGFLYDTFKSYDIPFIVAGSFLVTASLISSAIPFVIKFGVSKEPPALSNPFQPAQIHLEDIPEAREPEEDDSPLKKLDEMRAENQNGNVSPLQNPYSEGTDPHCIPREEFDTFSDPVSNSPH